MRIIAESLDTVRERERERERESYTLRNKGIDLIKYIKKKTVIKA